MSRCVQSCEITRDQWGAIMERVELWAPKWRRHLHVDDDLDELVQAVRIAAWQIASSLERRGKWVPGLTVSVVYYAWRRGWDTYRRDHRGCTVARMTRRSWANYAAEMEGEMCE
jgi:hypothetical protein